MIMNLSTFLGQKLKFVEHEQKFAFLTFGRTNCPRYLYLQINRFQLLSWFSLIE